ncbi:TPA: autotransporter outer membrane beta-barrel domain-containing protein [Stenotrophomonas maltophilia]|nr:autotransporter outer membrane beta-barrel domain-containing protein [Stenotrophomonas maltophilia]HDS1026455.1 autotransporter outer membrane beta-barrel domain-containing protein [Stenotrophomonas maltophilia]HDS1035566.1 autotransporter outer membrane beta-barrel domain-containing protein [Stenotrophomonas maltophilia]
MSVAESRVPRARLLTRCLLQALAFPTVLAAAPIAWAGCDSVAPVAGQTVTCSSAAPNPQTVPISASGAAGITVDVASGAQLQQSGGGSAIALVGAGGHVLSNQGAISSAGGVAVQLGAGSRVENNGSISTGNNTALQFVGAGDSVLVNRGTISGRTGVQSGAGNDRLEMLGGSISGGVLQGDGNDVLLLSDGTLDSVDQGNGADQMTVSGGSVTGLVAQGSGADDFLMTGGTVGALQQGDNIDTFRMSGGRIIGAFEDGDQAWMTGGRIGRVNMKLDRNLWDQSGGTVDGNVVTGFDTDTIIISGTAYIGGNISVSGGNDSVTITDGTVRGQVLLSTGNDTFNWNGGGIVYGAIDAGPDDDVATLSNLSQANMGAVPLFDGGSGNDRLSFNNVKTTGVSRFQNWEAVSLGSSTELTFDGDLVLGDSATGTGTLTVDGTSTVYAGSGAHAVRPFNAAALVDVINAGRIDLTGVGAGDVFTVRGNYRGDGGGLYLRTVLAADDSSSDRLVIDGGSATGTTGIGILNAGGGGAATLADGILVVQALNGATTAAGAFSLFAPVSAGAYEYFLFKGGVSAGTGENWYLRSTLVAGPVPAPNGTGINAEPPPPTPIAPPPPPIAPAPPPPPEGAVDPDLTAGEAAPPPPPPEPAPVAPPTDAAVPDVPMAGSSLPAAGATPPSPGARPAQGDVVPLYRLETAAYAVVPPLLRETSLASLGTFHERQGEQRLLYSNGALRTAWGRLVGQSSEIHWKGDAQPGFDGDVMGVQAGLDLWAAAADNHRNQVGVFVGRTRAQGRTTGLALGWENVQVGQNRVDDKHVGLYWTLTGSGGGYIDAVAMQSRYDGRTRSARGLGIDVKGDGTTLSLEAGKPVLQLGQSSWWLEPQVQVIWQRSSLDDQRDAVSTVRFDNDNAWTGRVGLRLAGDYQLADNGWQPYFKVNYWHGRSGEDRIQFDSDTIINSQRSRALEAGVGVVARFNRSISAYAVADYTRELGGDRNEKRRIIEGNIGLRADW